MHTKPRAHKRDDHLHREDPAPPKSNHALLQQQEVFVVADLTQQTILCLHMHTEPEANVRDETQHRRHAALPEGLCPPTTDQDRGSGIEVGVLQVGVSDANTEGHQGNA